MKNKMLLFAGFCLVAAGLLTGCNTATSGSGAGNRPLVAEELAPNADSYSLQKVAILDAANPTGKKEARQGERFMYAALAQSEKYFFTKSSSFARDAGRSGVEAEYDRLIEAWEKRRTLNKADVISVCEKAGYDAILTYEISRWDEEKVDQHQEGTSTSTVGYRIDLFASDGTRLWSGKSSKVEHSLPYNPDMHVKSTQSGEAVFDEGAIPLPPPIEPVAQTLATEIVSKLPVFGGAQKVKETP